MGCGRARHCVVADVHVSYSDAVGEEGEEEEEEEGEEVAAPTLSAVRRACRGV
jgi:hypothetical protein